MVDKWLYSFTTQHITPINPTPTHSLLSGAKGGYGILSLVYFSPSRRQNVEKLREIVEKVFEEEPGIMRITMFVPKPFGKARAVVKEAGFRWEGVLRDGVVVGAKLCDLVVYGMTRRDYVRSTA